MALNGDDLQRLRDAIDKGWDFTMCHELDFIAAVSELVNLAMEGGATLAQQVLDKFPGAKDVRSVIDELETLIDNDGLDLPPEAIELIQECVDKLENFEDALDTAIEKAEELL